MTRSFGLTLSFLALVLLGTGCSSTPATRYYQVIPEQVERSSGPGSLTLSIEALGSSAAYEDERIVYRTSPYQLDYYAYHRWSSPPSLMITDVLRQSLEQTGRFKTVLSGFATGADVVLRGRVLAIEEVDGQKGKWTARIVLDLQLLDARTGNIIWSKLIDRSMPVKDREPEGVVKAMSLGLRDVVQEIAPQLAGGS